MSKRSNLGSAFDQHSKWLIISVVVSYPFQDLPNFHPAAASEP